MHNGKGFLWIQGTTTKKFSFLFSIDIFQKKIIFSFFAFVCCAAFCFADSEKKWILAAEKFVLTQKNSDKSLEAVCSSMPSLILENFAENMERMPRSRENLDRALYDLQKIRLSLFIQLSKEVQTRDAVFLNNYSERKLKSKLKEQDKKIENIKKQLSENLNSVEEEKLKYSEQIEIDLMREKLIDEGKVVGEEKKENKFASFFKGMMTNRSDEFVVENVSLYQNDFSKLFDAGNNIKLHGYDSYEFEKACVDANINGLIAGKITVYGSYISVSVSVYQYPGARVIGYATDVGSTDNLKDLATSLAMQITPKIADTMPVELEISVEPEEAKNRAVLTVDDVVYKNIENSFTVQSGIHTIMFTSEGYETVSASYNFSGSRKFKIDVTMRSEQNGEIYLRLKKPYSGDIFGNSIFGGTLSEENPFGTIKINNSAVLGHFVTDEGLSADFYISEKYLKDGSYLKVDAKPFDRSEYIDKRRRWMYASYSSLILSLVPTFYCYGTSYSKTVAYNDGHDVSRSEAQNWQYASWAATGVSVSCGIFFVYELVRYLKAASSVLPVNAKTVGKKELKIIKKEKTEITAESEQIEKTSTFAGD